MKQMKKLMMVVLMMALLVATDVTSVRADSVAGKTETSAIELKFGKKKTNAFWTGKPASIYYVVGLPEQGRLSVSIAAKKLGMSATVRIRKTDVETWDESKSFSYNKKKKTTSGTFKPDYIFPKGNYIIEVTPEKTIKGTKKVSVTAKFTSGKFADQETNDTEETAQKIKVYNSGSYKMYLTSLHLFEGKDLADCLEITLKDKETVKITLSSKADMTGVKVLVREKKDKEYNTIKAYDVVNGKLSEKIELKKGTYYVKVWCADDSLERQMPYTIKCAAQ